MIKVTYIVEQIKKFKFSCKKRMKEVLKWFPGECKGKQKIKRDKENVRGFNRLILL